MAGVRRHAGGMTAGVAAQEGAATLTASDSPRHARVSLAWVFAALFATLFAASVVAAAIVDKDLLGSDAHAYWLTGHTEDLYHTGPATQDAFLYSPAFALLIHPLTWLPWPAFYVAWVGIEVAALVWLFKPLSFRWALPAFLLCLPELVIGNVYLLLALMVALGVRYPAAWAFGILTKITPGVGLVWFLVRGEWRNLAFGAGATVAVVGGSYLLAPSLWSQWAGFLLGNGDGSPGGSTGFLVRCAVAVALVAYAARADRPWVLAVAVILASPVLNTLAALSVLAAIPRLREGGQ